MKIYHSLLFLPVIGFFACNKQSAVEEETENRPNFILFITDDISPKDLGCYGNEAAKTPNIDKMAIEGMMFTNAYLTASSCSPSRCSIITGRYPHNTGAAELHTKLPENQVMFPEIMKEAGYYTVLSGKNHIGPATEAAFDTIDWGGGPGGEQFWRDHIKNRPADKPFFFWFASYDAHREWQIDSTAPVFEPENVWVPPMLYDGPKTRIDLTGYYHEVSRTDYYLGQIMQELKNQGIEDNTYIIYMSDNGRPFPRAKTRCYNSGMRTPFIVWNKKNIQPAVCSSLVSAIDIGSTLFELAGIETHPRFQGVSFAPLLEKPDSKVRDYVFAEHNWHVYRNHERMLRTGDFMYIRNAYHEKMNMCVESAPVFPAGLELWQAYEEGLTSPQQEDIFMEPRPEEELYNVKKDPFQFNNLAGLDNYKDKIKDLRQILNQWIEETGDNVPENPTPDREDLYRNQYPDFEYGEMPGKKTGADTITNNGPIVQADIVQ
jgi:N-sulfoglucosamine sulfohydrolase